MHLDLGGLFILFVIGGIIGLIAFSIYNKGRRDALTGNAEPPPITMPGGTEPPPIKKDYTTTPSTCVQCGSSIPAGSTICPKCGWSYENPPGPPPQS